MAAEIRVAAQAGACYGVNRALELAERCAQERAGAVHTLGPLIHNPIVVADLAERGVAVADSLDDVESGTVVIRSHGVVPAVIDEAEARGLSVVDATCPYVKKVHAAAAKLVREGYEIVIVGESGHPEVEGIVGHAGGRAHVVGSADDVDGLELGKRVGVVVQTTQTAQNLSSVTAALAPRVGELRVINTICAATSERQQAAGDLAREADCMVVVGGKNSGNTRRLAEICHAACPRTHHIEDASELDAAWFDGAELIGVTAGASTPQAHIERVVDAITALTDHRERA